MSKCVTSYRLYRLFSSAHYRLARRFTKAGLLALCGVFMTLGLAVDTEQSAAYQLLGILLCILVAGMVWAPFFRGRFEVLRHLPRFGTVDQPLGYHLTLVNKSASAQRELTLLEDLADGRPSLDEFHKQRRSFRVSRTKSRRRAATLVETPVPLLPPNGTAEAFAELTPLRRGPLRFRGVTVARPDPLGLFRGFVRCPAEQTVMILPRRYPLPRLALPGASRYQQGGVALAGSVGESEEFISLREYRRGDPLRHIHWKSWAKAGEPIVKEFQNEFFVRHALILDTFAGPERQEAFEEAISVAASFASTIETQESLLDLMFVGPRAFCFTAGRGVAHAEQMLEILASVSLTDAKPFRSLHDLVLQHTTALSGCICIFLAWDEPRRELVQLLKQLGLPVMVLVVQDVDEGRPLDPGPLEAEPHSLHAMSVGHVAEALQKLR
jgi:uncharacterized protein (DUF58 family)